MDNQKNSNPKSKGNHLAKKPKKSFFEVFTFILIIVFVIIVFSFFMLPHISFKQTKDIKNATPTYSLSDEKVFDNANYLTSKNLKIEYNNGISKVTASVYNYSQEIAKNIKCKFVLLDDSNNVVYNLDVTVARIKPNEFSSFSSISDLDLSKVTHYTVSLDV